MTSVRSESLIAPISRGWRNNERYACFLGSIRMRNSNQIQQLKLMIKRMMRGELKEVKSHRHETAIKPSLPEIPDAPMTPGNELEHLHASNLEYLTSQRVSPLLFVCHDGYAWGYPGCRYASVSRHRSTGIVKRPTSMTRVSLTDIYPAAVSYLFCERQSYLVVYTTRPNNRSLGASESGGDTDDRSDNHENNSLSNACAGLKKGAGDRRQSYQQTF